MNIAFYLISNAFHIYSMFLFVKLIFDRDNTNKIAELFAFVIYYILNSSAFLFGQKQIIIILSNIIPFFGITFLYKSSLLKKISSTLGISIFSIIIDILIMTIHNFLNINSAFFEMGFVTGIFLIAAMNFALHFKRKDKERLSELPTAYYVSVIFVPIGSIIIGFFTAKSLDIVSLTSSVIILLINADIFYLYDTLTDMFCRQKENELIRVQNKAYLNQIHILQEIQLKIRCLKHDMDNHLFKMQDLLESQKYLELAEYLDNAKQSVRNNTNIIKSGNDSVDSILNYKLMQIASMNVETDFKAIVPDNLKINSFDINIVLGNLVDNAIEALKSVSVDESKKLVIKIDSKQGYIKIYIGNTFDGIIAGTTRKGDKVNHGLGLKSVSQTVEKYGGLLKTNNKGKWFEASAIMYEK